jgi:predicted O-methyltransferase YrrM
MSQLHPANPYTGFPQADYALDLHGGREMIVLTQVIEQLRPRLVIEVGSWKGAIAVRIAELLRQQGQDSAVLCIDTWLGSLEHWDGSVAGWDIRPLLKYGYPMLYHQFLANVLHKGCEDMIVPIPNTSANAARWLGRRGVSADVVYIDASHEEDDVYVDLCQYWSLLRPGGAMCGDDWDAYWYGVICAVSRFAKERGLNIQTVQHQWALQKPWDR